jgi:uncharacterized membrane protein
VQVQAKISYFIFIFLQLFQEGEEKETHMDFEFNASKMSDSASRALGVLTTKFMLFKNVYYNIYDKLYKSIACSILDYSSENMGKLMQSKVKQAPCYTSLAFINSFQLLL